MALLDVPKFACGEMLLMMLCYVVKSFLACLHLRFAEGGIPPITHSLIAKYVYQKLRSSLKVNLSYCCCKHLLGLLLGKNNGPTAVSRRCNVVQGPKPKELIYESERIL
jgi:hypothetical protein